MRIKLTRPWSDYGTGTILEPHTGLARTLIDAGIATEIKGLKIVDAPAPAETETARADPDGERAVTPPPKPKRKRKGKGKAKAEDSGGE